MPYDPVYMRAWRLTHRTKRLATMKRWRDTHKEHRAAYDKTYRSTHLEQIAAQERKRDSENREAVRAYNNALYQANPEPARARTRKRRKTPQGRAEHRASDRRRRAQKANAPVNDLTHQQWSEIQERQSHRCYYCSKRAKGHLTQDHIQPLSKGGSHTVQNVIAACGSCNSRKHAGRPPIPVQPFLLTVAPSRKNKAS